MSKASLIIKMGIATCVLAFILFSASTFRTSLNLKNTITSGFQREVESIMSIIPNTMAAPLFDFDLDEVEAFINTLLANDIVTGIRVLEQENIIVEIMEPDLDESTMISIQRPIVITDSFGEEVNLGSVEAMFTTQIIENEIISGVRDSIIQSVLILLAIIIFNSIMLFRIVVKPIKLTSAKMKDISEGETDLTNRLTVQSGDEVGLLSRYFNDFLGNLDNLVLEIRASLDVNLKIQTNLGANTEESVTSLNQMTANIDSSKKQMEILSNAITTSNSVVSNLVEQIERTIHNVEGQSAMVEQTSASVTELLASIDNVTRITQREKELTDKLVTTARTGGDQLRDTTEVITQIEQSIDEIQEFLTIINNISEQTNLLAMNAAIEAAHAGNAGRGFSVVAVEIRKLAEGSGINAKSIAAVLEQIIGKIHNAAKLSQQTNSAFADIDNEVNQSARSLDEISAAMSEMNTGSREIHKAVGSLNSVSQELVRDAQQMKEGSAAIGDAMGRITDVSNVVDSATAEIRLGIHEINTAMNQVADINNDLGSNTQELNLKMSRFKTSDPVAEEA